MALSLFSYYRRFIYKFLEKAKPLYDLLKKYNKFEWGPEQEQSMGILKQHLISAPIRVRNKIILAQSENVWPVCIV